MRALGTTTRMSILLTLSPHTYRGREREGVRGREGEREREREILVGALAGSL